MQSALRNFSVRWNRFWFNPRSSFIVDFTRFVFGLYLCYWLLCQVGAISYLFASDGLITKDVLKLAAQNSWDSPPIGWLPVGWSPLYLFNTSPVLLQAFFWFAVLNCISFTLGLGLRITSVLTWLTVLSFTSTPGLFYGADLILQMLSFYLMIAYLFEPVRSTGSVLQWIDRKDFLRSLISKDDESSIQSEWTGFILRIMQIHFCVIMCTNGLAKLQMGTWWSGTALWFPYFPANESTLSNILSYSNSADTLLFFLSFAAYCVIAWQVAYPMFAYHPSFRAVFYFGTVVSTLGCMYFYGLPIYGPLYLVGGIAFLNESESSWIHRTIQQRAQTMFAAKEQVPSQKTTVKETAGQNV